ncbi:MAG: GlsB/YeaQ/YmgE family stress response membrane protein [Spirochaetae bacterium HGW-Spirochaetae-1]|nr:MAG: GlsB/YeaQ/YmgE family stress response membrane protein [Spirochaetae bacterium HGW-Spirochaetae-1]
MTGIIVTLIVGAVAGWLAGLIWKGKGFGLLWNIIIGVAGSFIGSFLLRLIGLHAYGLIGSIVAALAGALVLLAVINQIKK